MRVGWAALALLTLGCEEAPAKAPADPAPSAPAAEVAATSLPVASVAPVSHPPPPTPVATASSDARRPPHDPPLAPTASPTGQSISDFVAPPHPVDPASGGCACHTDEGGFQVALACGAESCIEGTKRLCSADGKLTKGAPCGAVACVCHVVDSDGAEVNLACGVSVCLNGTTVECGADGKDRRGGTCKN